MGGFEGGDEAGFWDIDTLPLYNESTSKHHKPTIEKSDSGYSIKAHAKVTIFLKITGYENERPTLLSRFVRLNELFDTISLVPSPCTSFTIEGCDEIPLESNTIYKVYQALIDYTADSDIVDFFYEHKVVVKKGIPSSSGLGGSASDAAAFLLLLKEACNLVLSNDELTEIGMSLGSELPFFISNLPCANVSGFGEIVEAFEEESLDLEFYSSKSKCDSALLYETFKEHLLSQSDPSSFEHWQKLDSKSILENVSDPLMLNDLYAASQLACPGFKQAFKEGWFFSAPGSTFFKLH